MRTGTDLSGLRVDQKLGTFTLWLVSLRCGVLLYGKGSDLRRALIALVVISSLTAAPFPARATKPSNPYPNELPGFKFYAKYLYPLRPMDSMRAQVLMVLGSDRVEAGQWWIAPEFLVERTGPENKISSNRLASIRITPKGRVSMLAVKFPAAFTHSHGEVSESDGCSCDVYSDRFGLQYWIDQAGNGQNDGDVYQIIYGPAR